ncbi:Hypothetical predicted protein [Mytilus galloprovincialis]|uniref:Uncharacterized protein n=1 Tax=Mytilus galloprovincialis TaxID=29158 RepID=A0A8B6FZY0_MYTGA|nr:Hypothetical predicted protein [Mytilus galloprovincialis]
MPLREHWDGFREKVLEFNVMYPTAHVICLAWIDNDVVSEGTNEMKNITLELIKKYKDLLTLHMLCKPQLSFPEHPKGGITNDGLCNNDASTSTYRKEESIMPVETVAEFSDEDMESMETHEAVNVIIDVDQTGERVGTGEADDTYHEMDDPSLSDQDKNMESKKTSEAVKAIVDIGDADSEDLTSRSTDLKASGSGGQNDGNGVTENTMKDTTDGFMCDIGDCRKVFSTYKHAVSKSGNSDGRQTVDMTGHSVGRQDVNLTDRNECRQAASMIDHNVGRQVDINDFGAGGQSTVDISRLYFVHEETIQNTYY